MTLIARGRGIVSVALCALAAHAALYGSFAPGGGMHGYFSWYEPLVAGLTGAAVLTVAVLVVAASLGYGRSRLRELLPAPKGSAALQAARLAQAALVVLFLQETLERSLTLGHVAVPSFAPSTWLLVLVSLAFVAALLVLAGRLGARIVTRLLGGDPRRPFVSPAAALPRPIALRRRSPLADRRALRAPPLLAG
jgi:hypothetical protein